jgi:hypothetical protein
VGERMGGGWVGEGQLDCETWIAAIARAQSLA